MEEIFSVNWPVADARWRTATWVVSTGDLIGDEPTREARILRNLHARVEATDLPALARTFGATHHGAWRARNGSVADLATVALYAPAMGGAAQQTNSAAQLPIRRLIRVGDLSLGLFVSAQKVMILHPLKGLFEAPGGELRASLAEMLGRAELAALETFWVTVFRSAIETAAALSVKQQDPITSKHIHLWDATPGAAGGDNPVYRVICKTRIGSSDRNCGFFKADVDQPGAHIHLEKVGLVVNEKAVATNFSTRAVASGALARALGLTNLLSADTYAEHDGARGLLSPATRGRACLRKRVSTEKDLDKSAQLAAASTDPAYRKTLTESWSASNLIDGDDVYPFLPETEEDKEPVDWQHQPGGMKSVFDLQALDYLTGQIDRHPGDVLWDAVAGCVRGIDNDLCFGRDNTRLFNPALSPGAWKGLPPLLDRRTAQAILKMPSKRQKTGLKARSLPAVLLSAHRSAWGQLTDEEIGAASARLDQLKQHLTQHADEVIVDDWQQLDPQRAIAGGSDRNLLAALME